MASCIIIMLWVWNELGFDKFHNDSNRIYRVMSYGTTYMQEGFDGTPALLSYDGNEMIPEIEQSTCFESIDKVLFKYDDKGFYESNGIVCDSSFFDLFSFNFILGEPSNALSAPYNLVLTASMAKKYFEDRNPLGEVIYLDDIPLKVTAVIEDIPENSTIVFDFAVPLSIYKTHYKIDFSWGRMMYATFMKLHEKANPDTVAARLTRLALRQGCPQVQDGIVFRMQSLGDIHLDGKHNDWRVFYKSIDIRYIRAFSVIAIFILIIACINYINLATAKSEKRSKEVGMRKVVGASRLNIIKQFMGESLILSLFAVFLGLIFVELFRPFFGQLTNSELKIDYFHPGFLLLIAGVFVSTTLLSGFYPAFILSSFSPLKVMKGTLKHGKGGSVFRIILVIFQFIIASGLIISLILMFTQLSFVQNKDLGFKPENILYMPFKENVGKEYKYIKLKLLENPYIEQVSGCDYLWATDDNSCSGCFRWEGYTDEDAVDMLMPRVDYDYFKLMGIPIVEGRTFSSELQSDSSKSFMVNQSAAKIMGEEALGIKCKMLKYTGGIDQEGPLIGIFKDVHFKSLHNKIGPQVVRVLKDPAEFSRGVMLVKVNPENIKSALKTMEEVWNEVNQFTPFEYKFLSQTYSDQYIKDRNTARIIGYFSLLAIFISCLGIFGLAAFMAERKTKEIGIRKVNGASTQSIVLMMSKEFSKLVVVGYIISCPIAWYIMDKVLNTYEYRISIDFWPFIISFILVFFIAFVTVGYQAFKVAKSNPVDALRYE